MFGRFISLFGVFSVCPFRRGSTFARMQRLIPLLSALASFFTKKKRAGSGAGAGMSLARGQGFSSLYFFVLKPET